MGTEWWSGDNFQNMTWELWIHFKLHSPTQREGLSWSVRRCLFLKKNFYPHVYLYKLILLRIYLNYMRKYTAEIFAINSC